MLVANSVRADDGRWRTIDAIALYDHAKTGGYVYQAQLRHELTARLGVDWTPVHDGLADIVGVDEDLIGLFSKRREQIEADHGGVGSHLGEGGAGVDLADPAGEGRSALNGCLTRSTAGAPRP